MDEALRLIPDVVAALTTAEEPFDVLAAPDGQQIFRRLEARFPFGAWGGIAWDQSGDHSCLEWVDWEDCARQLDRLCEQLHLDDDAVVVICWTNMRSPSLQLSLSVARRHAAVVFAADFDTWIFAADQSWCFQAHHDGLLCFGYAPAVTA
jgi:hypothetical protein